MRAAQTGIVIVGGSLAGLTLALACARHGIPVRVIERAARRALGGDSLAIDVASVAQVTGQDARGLPVVHAYRDRHLVTWPALYGWLRACAATTPGIEVEEGRNVTGVVQAEGKERIAFADGNVELADAVIGADGYHSIVRRALSPEAPLAQYAGYLVWRGLIDEATLARPVDWPSNGGLWIERVGGYRLVAAVLPGRDGSIIAGQRQITVAWFDVHRTGLLREHGLLTAENALVGTLGRGTIPAGVRDDLLALVPQLWPAQWAPAVTAVVQSDALSGAPIAEYTPPRLAQGALALVGDAAHVISPMTGAGYATAVDDAAQLAVLLASARGGDAIAGALARYQDDRLPYVRGLVAHSRRLSADFLDYANRSSAVLNKVT